LIKPAALPYRARLTIDVAENIPIGTNIRHEYQYIRIVIMNKQVLCHSTAPMRGLIIRALQALLGHMRIVIHEYYSILTIRQARPIFIRISTVRFMKIYESTASGRKLRQFNGNLIVRID
jgi:hypothetical protein